MFYLWNLLLSAHAMDANAFTQLMQQIDQASFSSDKQLIVSSLPSSSKITCAQAKQIIAEFSFSDDKLQALQNIVDNISDLENYYTMYDVFSFSSDKEKAKTILETEFNARKTTAAQYQEKKAQHDQRQHNANEQQKNTLDAREQQLNALEKQLQEKERLLREMELLLKQKELDLRERELQLASQGSNYSHHNRHSEHQNQQASAQPSFEWVGFCPLGTDASGKAQGSCYAFDANAFNPLVSNGQQLWLLAKSKGTVDVEMVLGGKQKSCKPVGKQTPDTLRWKIPVQEGQLVNMGEYVDNWDRSSISVTANLQGYSQNLVITDWQHCK